MKCLFMGGHHNGKMMDVGNAETRHFLILPAPADSSGYFTRQLYERSSWFLGSNSPRYIYIYGIKQPNEVWDKLLDAYQKQAEIERAANVKDAYLHTNISSSHGKAADDI